MASPEPVLGRICGDCALCCKLPEIPALAKPPGLWCVHCSTRKTCDAYDTRPEPCRDFQCQYIVNPNLSEEWKPTNARFLLTIKQGAGMAQVVAMVDPARADAWRKEPYFSALKQWSSNNQVLITIGRRKIALFPDHEVDLGESLPGDVIEYIGTPTENGMRVTAQVRRMS